MSDPLVKMLKRRRQRQLQKTLLASQQPATSGAISGSTEPVKTSQTAASEKPADPTKQSDHTRDSGDS